MSSRYTNTLRYVWSALIDWVNDDMHALLINNERYSFDIAHDSLADIDEAAIIAETNITGKYIDEDNLFCDAFVFSAVEYVTGVTGDSVIVFKNDKTISNAKLCFYLDESIGLPVTPDGDDIVITFPSTGLRSLNTP